MVAVSVLKISQLFPGCACVTPDATKKPASSFMPSVLLQSFLFSASRTPLYCYVMCSATWSHLLIEGRRWRKLVSGAAYLKYLLWETKKGPSALIHISEIIKESSQSQLLWAPGNMTQYWIKTSHDKGFRSGLCLPPLFLQQTGEREWNNLLKCYCF